MKVKLKMMMDVREDGMQMTNQVSLMMQIAMTTMMEMTGSSECDPEVCPESLDTPLTKTVSRGRSNTLARFTTNMHFEFGDPAPINRILCVKISDVARGEFHCDSDPPLEIESEGQQRRTEPV